MVYDLALISSFSPQLSHHPPFFALFKKMLSPKHVTLLWWASILWEFGSKMISLVRSRIDATTMGSVTNALWLSGRELEAITTVGPAWNRRNLMEDELWKEPTNKAMWQPLQAIKALLEHFQEELDCKLCLAATTSHFNNTGHIF